LCKDFSSGEIELWRVILSFIGARATVNYFCRRLDQVGALSLSFNLHGSHFVFRQLLSFKNDALGGLKRPKGLDSPLEF
jgi:hypothetical protein